MSYSGMERRSLTRRAYDYFDSHRYIVYSIDAAVIAAVLMVMCG